MLLGSWSCCNPKWLPTQVTSKRLCQTIQLIQYKFDNCFFLHFAINIVGHLRKQTRLCGGFHGSLFNTTSLCWSSENDLWSAKICLSTFFQGLMEKIGTSQTQLSQESLLIWTFVWEYRCAWLVLFSFMHFFSQLDDNQKENVAIFIGWNGLILLTILGYQQWKEPCLFDRLLLLIIINKRKYSYFCCWPMTYKLICFGKMLCKHLIFGEP